MDFGQLTPALVLTLAGASIVTSIVIGVIIKAWAPTPAQKDRFGPLLALVVGVLVTVGFAAVQGADLTNAVLVGILTVGPGSMGVHDLSGALGGP